MAYSEYLADRIRKSLKDQHSEFMEKKMMGGLTFMVDDKMCVGVIGESLMARIDPEIYDEALQKNGCRQMDFTGKPMKGFVLIDAEGIDQDNDLDYWVNLCLNFNRRDLPISK